MSTPSCSSGRVPIPSFALFDLVIIGSGPSSLSLVARLLEKRPAALYTEEEHAHLSWLHRPSVSSNKMKGRNQANVVRTRKGGMRGNSRFVVLETAGDESHGGAKGGVAPRGMKRILIVDKLGGWMRAWDNAFKAFDIRYLRSPLFWHPCPADRDGLLAFATLNGQAQVIEPSDFVAAMRRGKAKPIKGIKARRRRAIDKVGGHSSSSSSSRRGSADSNTSDASPAVGETTSSQSSATCCDSSHCCVTSIPSSSPSPLRAGLLEIAGCVGKEMSKHKKRLRAASRPTATTVATSPSSSSSEGPRLRSLGTDVNERDRKDYHAASTGLFREFVKREVVQRYGLEGDGGWEEVGKARERWEREELGKGEGHDVNCRNDSSPCIDTVKSSAHCLRWTQLELESTSEDSFGGFEVQLDGGMVVGARSVVLAVGPSGGRVNVPQVLRQSSSSSSSSSSSNADNEEGEKVILSAPSLPPPTHGPGWAHTAALASPSFPFPSPPLTSSSEASTLVVIGGGLTSAQICDLGVRKGFEKVILLLRGHMKVKPFDVGLEWLGRYSNIKKMQFWQEELASSRLDMVRSARQGGSITPVYADILRSHVSDGRLEILEHTHLTKASYDDEKQEWSLGLANARSDVVSASEDMGERKASYIISATGAAPSILDLGLLKPIHASHPIPTEGGLPLITEDLQWRNDLPLFVVGGFSALQIGPGAGNLGGMQEAADRAAQRLSELFQAASDKGNLELVASLEEGDQGRGRSDRTVSSSNSSEEREGGGEGKKVVVDEEGGTKVPRSRRHRGSETQDRRASTTSRNKEEDPSHLGRALEAMSHSPQPRSSASSQGDLRHNQDEDDEEEEGDEGHIKSPYARSNFSHFGFYALTVEG